MGNIITYVQEQGGLTFDELGFNAVDSLILSSLAYLDFSGCAGPDDFSPAFGDLRSSENRPHSDGSDAFTRRCAALFDALAGTPRYRGLSAGQYVSRTDAREEQQFAAVTFRLSPRLHYIAYRGTDSSWVGWKEDLNLSFVEDLPAQKSALAYLERALERNRGHWILGGHSKGGNLAVYAALSAPPKAQRDIALVYDHDGPGFLERVLQRPGFQAVRGRIHKTVPESAVVGLLLAEHAKYEVVESDALAILQHDPFSWQVEGADFVRAADTDILSKTTDRTLSRWLAAMDGDARRAFVDALDGLIQATGATTVPELTGNWRQNLPALHDAILRMDPETRRMLFDTVGNLVHASGDSVRELLDERLAQAREEVRGGLRERLQQRKAQR